MKVVPAVGMPARILHLGAEEAVVVEEVRDGGREIVAGGLTFALNAMTGRFVRDGDPYYGVRLVLDG
ncbi:MAG: hypothetical protein ACJ762_08550 [Solirubrobacteraceae bacterium]